MRCYRIMSDSYHRSPYSCSAGAGRWNPQGSTMIYAGSAPSVALLEYLCIKGPAVGIKPWYVIVYDIADETLIGTLGHTNLPDDWGAVMHGKATQDFGKAWLREMEFPFLRVPSSRVNISFYPLEFNVLINPDFPNIKDVIKVVDSIAFRFVLNPWKP